ncbi:MAG: hypothetical protein ABIJ59_03065 [Pseudomonadota bacterium]
MQVMVGGNKVAQGIKKFLSRGFILMVCVWFVSCSKPPEAPEPEYIIKTALMTISSEDFSEELDLKRAAYPYNIKGQASEYNEMVIHLVKVLSEEIILLSVAQNLGIIVTDQEVDAAEAQFKKDYPEDSFDQMLLTNAISYSFWKKRFKKNMIMDKLIGQELEKKIEISSQDILDFYKNHSNTNPDPSDQTGEGIKIFQDEEQLVSSLRMQKTQEYYEEWVQKLWNQYPVEIDKEKLKAFLIDLEISKESLK